MMRPNILGRVGMALAVVALAGGAVAGAAGAATPTPTPPHIVARPNNVMVNTTVKLVGTGFPPRATLTIEECGQTTWIVGQQAPCDTNNTITVVTNRYGRFAGLFKVELCPRSQATTPPITQETCYVGNPQPRGIDTITLVGAAKITVTYP
jgi:hypothetical protein